MRKKIFSALLVISAFGLMLSGCGSKEPTTSNEGENTQNNEGDNKGNEGENEQGGKEEGNEGNKDALDTNYPTTIPNLNEPAFQIHYKRKDNKYAEWGLWIWADGKDGAEYTFNYQDETGVIAYYPISTFGSTSIGFLTKKLFSVVGNNVWIKDTYADDRKLDLANLDPDENGCYHIFINDYEETIYVKNDYKTKMNVISTCEFSSYKKLVVSGNNKIKNVVISASGTEIVNKSFETPVTRAEIDFEEEIDISTPYTAIVTFEDDSKLSSGISILKLYNSEFDEKYGYDGELGAIYSKDSTTFRVWSPISSKIILNIYDTGTPEDLGEGGTNTPTEVREMVKNEKGVFEITVNGDLHGKYYTYTVFNGYNLEGREIVDPYAKSAGVNGLRGMVVDFSRTNPDGWDEVDYLNYDRKATVVYETHVADVSSSKTWGGHAENAKKFTGLIETGTSYVSEDDDDNKVSTGFDSIKELGVNAVQLLPIFDQANDEINTSFNWGYNPLNYNVLEGSYSSDPYDGLARIREFKTVVRDYNEAGMSIIMDVVYNHVNGIDRSNFDTLMPYYYFRYVSSKTPYNGSGCGNETASEKAMFRKFMIDSTEFWMKEYKLGGFRFDLMGLHDTATMNLLVENLKEINPNALVYGEPWTGGASGLKASESAIQRYANKYKGFGAFNDLLRDSLIKGGLNPVSEKGWVTEASKKSSIGDLRDSLKGMTGTFTSDPNKMVAYATCHDNYTLHDRARVAGIKDEEMIKKMNLIANSVVFSSQGTSFMLAGEEFLRSKSYLGVDDEETFSGNSYNLDYSVNELNYAKKLEHYDLFKNYKKLINFKRTHKGLQLEENEIEGNLTVEALNNNGVMHIAYKGGEGEGNEPFDIYIANGTAKDFQIDESQITREIYLNTANSQIADSKLTIEPFGVLIF